MEKVYVTLVHWICKRQFNDQHIYYNHVIDGMQTTYDTVSIILFNVHYIKFISLNICKQRHRFLAENVHDII